MRKINSFLPSIKQCIIKNPLDIGPEMTWVTVRRLKDPKIPICPHALIRGNTDAKKKIQNI
uniref:Uncharacterized protein n=1 Tax=Meloidogyne incognita TaxID=6306 RepID=A0A914N7M4_MELIC